MTFSIAARLVVLASIFIFTASCTTTATNAGKGLVFSDQSANGLLLVQLEFDHDPPHSYVVTIAPFDVDTNTTGEPINLGMNAMDAFGFRAISEIRKSTVKRHHLTELTPGVYVIERINRWHSQVSATTIFCSTRKFTVLPGKVNNVGDVRFSFTGNRGRIRYVRPPERSEARDYLSGYHGVTADVVNTELVEIERQVIQAERGEVNANGFACQ